MPDFKLHSRLHHLSRPLHIGLCLVLLSLCVLFLADLLGFREDGRAQVSESRRALAETTAMHLSTLANIDDTGAIQYAISELVSRGSDVRAVSLVRTGGIETVSYGEDHLLQKFSPVTTLSHIAVPIFNGQENWGELRLVFTPMHKLLREMMGVLFFILTSLIAFTTLLNKAFIQLDPNQAVPGRVDTAFNMFASGVIILDDKLRIIMANEAACKMAEKEGESLIGTAMDSWQWQEDPEWQEPWKTTLHSGFLVSDKATRLVLGDGSTRLVMVSCTLVGDEDKGPRGVMVTLDDVSSIEKKNNELAMTLGQLRSSQKQLSAKNKELERLATTDALTGISNRRVLMEKLAKEFNRAKSENSLLSCIMTDIDHFKSVNDNYGHAVGDDVICAIAATLSASCEENQTVGRYGGEEFVLILPGINAEAAAKKAEALRLAIESLTGSGVLAVSKLSSSFGVSDMLYGAEDGNSLVDQADQALYEAKQNGRNCVYVFDSTPASSGSKNVALKTQSTPIEPSEARLDELEALLEERNHEIEILRHYDALTGIPMRTLFIQRVEIEQLRAKRKARLIGVLSLEMRELDRLVSSFGHSASDDLVIAVVERLQEGLRSSDLVTEISADHTLSRIASNEFGILLTEIVETSDALVVITRLKRLLAIPFYLGNQKVYVGANIGIALSPSDEKSASWLFGQASKARMAAASNHDKVSHVFATATLNDQSQEYIALESDLHDAIDANELQVYYQPKFDLTKRAVTGMEALIRWDHKTRGFVPPDVFVGIAEENGLIEQLSQFVVNETLQQISSWQAMGFYDLIISVNVSPMQLRAESLVQTTLAALERTGVNGKYLEVELTETSVLDNPEKAVKALNRLRGEGISISIDDFGTGYTSIGLLSNLPIDVLKIDRSFISAMRSSEQDRLIVQSIIAMARALKLRVVGEGVETNEDLEILAKLGCDMIQGYLISRPIPPDQMTVFLEQQKQSANIRQA